MPERQGENCLSDPARQLLDPEVQVKAVSRMGGGGDWWSVEGRSESCMLVKVGSHGKWFLGSDGLGSLAGGVACTAGGNDKKRPLCQRRLETVSL